MRHVIFVLEITCHVRVVVSSNAGFRTLITLYSSRSFIECEIPHPDYVLIKSWFHWMRDSTPWLRCIQVVVSLNARFHTLITLYSSRGFIVYKIPHPDYVLIKSWFHRIQDSAPWLRCI